MRWEIWHNLEVYRLDLTFAHTKCTIERNTGEGTLASWIAESDTTIETKKKQDMAAFQLQRIAKLGSPCKDGKQGAPKFTKDVDCGLALERQYILEFFLVVSRL